MSVMVAQQRQVNQHTLYRVDASGLKSDKPRLQYNCLFWELAVPGPSLEPMNPLYRIGYIVLIHAQLQVKDLDELPTRE